MPRMLNQHQILVGLGGNLPSPYGSPRDSLREAIAKLSKSGLEGLEVSSLYRTAPVPAAEQPDFLNCVLAARTALSPENLLSLFKETEKEFGRQTSDRWSSRTLDVDLLAYSSSILPSREIWDQVTYSKDATAYVEAVTVPHPRLHKRAFVLLPLMEIAPQWIHPCLKQSVKEMAKSAKVKLQARNVVKVSNSL